MMERISGYDLIRSLAILVVFLSHIIIKQSTNETLLLLTSSLSPGLTMSLLGFISAAILSSREHDPASFLVKRFSRIYISLLLCLIIIILVHKTQGKNVITQHTLLHIMGLSAFFDIFLVTNKATVGEGLWFISTINLLYLLLPLFRKILTHPNKIAHLFAFVLACTGLNFFMYGSASIWNVAISFAIGVYFGSNGLINRLVSRDTNKFAPVLFCIGLLVVVMLSTAHLIPYFVRGFLFALYPIAFVPFLFQLSSILPPKVLVVSTFFAGLSYEFYILHFYFINDGFKEFFPVNTPMFGQILISFFVTLVLAYGISKLSNWLRKRTDNYLIKDQ